MKIHMTGKRTMENIPSSAAQLTSPSSSHTVILDVDRWYHRHAKQQGLRTKMKRYPGWRKNRRKEKRVQRLLFMSRALSNRIPGIMPIAMGFPLKAGPMPITGITSERAVPLHMVPIALAARMQVV
jgi:hypothetical protein